MKKITTAAITAGLLLVPVAATTVTAAPVTTTAHTAAVSTSVAQTQAIREAKSYLRYTSFSRTGLIEQLEYEGYGRKISARAVDSLKVNWNKQAAKEAKSYLRYTSFSHKGLYEQLRYEGYTASQAKYGVRSVGL